MLTSTIFSELATIYYFLYLLRSLSSKRYHFEGKVVNWLDVGDDGFEIDIAETDIIAEKSCCYR